jgi:hypothetical protein
VKLATALVACAALWASAHAATDAEALRYDKGAVSGTLDAVPADEAVESLATATGARLEGTVIAPKPVTASFRNESIEGALARILGQQNFTVRYGSEDRVKSITLLGGPAAAKPAPAPPAATEPSVEAKTPSAGYGFPVELSRALQRHRPLPLPDVLAKSMGVEEATVPELLDTATLDEDGVTRAQASQVVLSALEMNGRLRRSFLRTLHDLDDEQFAAILEAESGPRFVEVVEFLTAHSREPSIKKKAGVILEQLRPPPAGPVTPQ